MLHAVCNWQDPWSLFISTIHLKLFLSSPLFSRLLFQNQWVFIINVLSTMEWKDSPGLILTLLTMNNDSEKQQYWLYPSLTAASISINFTNICREETNFSFHGTLTSSFLLLSETQLSNGVSTGSSLIWYYNLWFLVYYTWEVKNECV